jgi:hypothetical protein
MTKALQERSDADEAWRTEQAENNFLRERIADIAAQVAHLSMNDVGSPIASILKEATSGIRPAGHDRVNGSDGGSSPGTNLVERIRKLETATAASRVSSAS